MIQGGGLLRGLALKREVPIVRDSGRSKLALIGGLLFRPQHYPFEAWFGQEYIPQLLVGVLPFLTHIPSGVLKRCLASGTSWCKVLTSKCQVTNQAPSKLRFLVAAFYETIPNGSVVLATLRYLTRAHVQDKQFISGRSTLPKCSPTSKWITEYKRSETLKHPTHTLRDAYTVHSLYALGRDSTGSHVTSFV